MAMPFTMPLSTLFYTLSLIFTKSSPFNLLLLGEISILMIYYFMVYQLHPFSNYLMFLTITASSSTAILSNFLSSSNYCPSSFSSKSPFL